MEGNQKLSHLREAKLNVLQGIVFLLKSMEVGDVKLLKTKDEYLVNVNGDTVLETEDNLVHKHFTKLNIKVTQRISLAKLSDALQFIESEEGLTVDALNEEYINDIVDSGGLD